MQGFFICPKIPLRTVFKAVRERKRGGIVYLRFKTRPVEQPDYTIFCTLYRKAYHKCFGQELAAALTETESKIFYNRVLEATGLTIGWRSLKNYSFYIFHPDKDENPSIATLDTLARYVLQAPYTNDIARKNSESHHPYWYLYREQYLKEPQPPITEGRIRRRLTVLFASIFLLLFPLFYLWMARNKPVSFTDDFSDVSEAGLSAKGWQALHKDAFYWNKRQLSTPGLTLFTLPGDNWPDSAAKPAIKNLLVKELPTGCYAAELQLKDFIPAAEWQQAGLLLMQDTSLNSPSMRISLSFNDYFGGYKRPKEIIVQAIASPENGAKPEEFVHWPVVTLDSAGLIPALLHNLKYASLRIEKQGSHFRLLYAGGTNLTAAFKELAVRELTFTPHYVALFALKGNVPSSAVVPVKVMGFALKSMACN
jgi:hypothetical protein